MSTVNSEFLKQVRTVRRFDNRDAIAAYVEAAEKLVLDWPDRARAWLELGVALTRVARYKEARLALDKSLRLCQPERAYFLYFLKGDLYQQRGDLRQAERWFRKSLELNQKYPESWAFLGSLLAQKGDFSGAKEAWRTLIGLGTGATDEGHLNLGLILRAEKRYKTALKHAEKALEIDPQYTEAKRLKMDLLTVLR